MADSLLISRLGNIIKAVANILPRPTTQTLKVKAKIYKV